jgi:hypothetical protein
LVVIPCLRQCAPPELKARLPPIEQICWLHDRDAALRVDRQHAVQTVERDHDAAGHRQRAPRERRAAAPGHERRGGLVTGAHDRDDLVGALHHGDREWLLLIRGQRVGAEGGQLRRIAQHLLAEQAAEVVEDRYHVRVMSGGFASVKNAI